VYKEIEPRLSNPAGGRRHGAGVGGAHWILLQLEVRPSHPDRRIAPGGHGSPSA